MSSEGILQHHDEWLIDRSSAVALVIRQALVSVEGKGATIFPPTYAKPERRSEEDWLGYNIDRFADGTSVCQIDSVGSQANRIEPIFKSQPYSALVPQVFIQAGNKKINLLDAGHRAGDAIVRFSNQAERFSEAFQAWLDNGNALPLAKIAPTSIVFGSWDSRATQAKLPRIVRSVIRGFNVRALHRSAQYVPPIDYVGTQLIEAARSKQEQDSMSELGLSHAPAPWTHGGVQIDGGIRRDAVLNLVALRALGVTPENMDGVMRLRRYILGLALVSFTTPQETFLREGCQLVADPEKSTELSLVRHSGERLPFNLTHQDALSFAEVAARDFGVGDDIDAVFESDGARRELGQTSGQRKAGRRRGRIAAQPAQSATQTDTTEASTESSQMQSEEQ